MPPTSPIAPTGELGFDYLRDNMAHSLEELVQQRGHNYAIVDEVDSILIDEARTPLIISGPADDASSWYTEFARLAPLMERDVHYEVDLKKRTIGVHELGVEFVEDQLGIDNLYEAANSPLVSYLNNSIKAKGTVRARQELHRPQRRGPDRRRIQRPHVDRPPLQRGHAPGDRGQRRRRDQGREPDPGHHHAAELLPPLQQAVRYDGHRRHRGSGASEIYKLGVVPIPTNRPMVRMDKSDLIYKTEEAKFIAVVDDISERYEKGQPVLIGTTSVERSEYLSRQLTKRRIPHNVLNAKYHEQEAGIIAEAGRSTRSPSRPTWPAVAPTSCWGGNADFLLDRQLRDRGLDPIETPDEYEAAWHEELPKVKAQVAAESKDVTAAGGLYVLGTERHESRRIDNQLRGRSGRQGDVGESRFYLSLGDELMRRFNGAALESLLTRLNLPDDVPIEAKMVTRAIKSAQTQVEQQNFEIRKNVLKYDEVMNQQRVVIYKERNRILKGENLKDQAIGMVVDVVTAYVEGATAEGYAEDWDFEGVVECVAHPLPGGHRSPRSDALRRGG